ncbi:ABC transporter ATP-binding protein [Fructilactobacillus hinvesii]|uniref:ABC transporter ATP-binding protein n=1 Tax=Fructilactobacillus hinvesii TaxID=2940300 RepID=A0ABY5BVW8_9LACO|nr:ABC transporter ATP-binding protein [Fructilactobacillus hinvesii]USS88577.1 ABC transporter ATP-binding protein [Fructilactobacillus hinvesii]
MNLVPAIEVDGLEQGYGKTIVLKKIDLTVKRGQILALIGPSGSGKSTLIKSIMGMLLPRKGSVKVLDTNMPNRLVLGKIGFMAQNDALYQELTGKENLQFFGSLLDLSKSEVQDQMDYVASIVNLGPQLNKFVKDYSGGMKRRLSLAISLLGNPDLLILDEPTVGIDPELRDHIWDELHKLANGGCSILLTTHVMEDAEQADQLLMIRRGETIAQGAPQQLLEQYKVDEIEDVFIAAGRDQDARLGSD